MIETLPASQIAWPAVVLRMTLFHVQIIFRGSYKGAVQNGGRDSQNKPDWMLKYIVSSRAH